MTLLRLKISSTDFYRVGLYKFTKRRDHPYEAFCHKTPRIFYDFSWAISPAFSQHFLPHFFRISPAFSTAFSTAFLPHSSRIFYRISTASLEFGCFWSLRGLGQNLFFFYLSRTHGRFRSAVTPKSFRLLFHHYAVMHIGQFHREADGPNPRSRGSQSKGQNVHYFLCLTSNSL